MYLSDALKRNKPRPVFLWFVRLLQLQLIEVCPAILKISDTAVAMQLVKERKIHLGYQYPFCIGGRFALNRVGRECKLAWCEYRRLAVLDIHILNLWKIAYATGDGHKTFIFYSPGLGA